MRMMELFESARKVGVPIVVIRTADQMATLEATAKTQPENAVLLKWDAAVGCSGLNKAGQAVARDKGLEGDECLGFVGMMVKANSRNVLPQGAILYCLNAHKQLLSQEPMATASAVQAVANVRDTFKLNFRMLVLLGPGFVLPTELAQDVMVLDDELPDRTELRNIVREINDSARKTTPKVPKLSEEDEAEAAEALSGLTGFAAEQQTAMAYTEQGLQKDRLWERKRVAIEQTPGLGVWRGTERFSDVIGADMVKARLRQYIGARRPIGTVVWLDEIDKVFANIEHDTTNVRMDQYRTFLTEMENNEWEGVVLAGMPGGGKSLLSKAFGNEVGAPTIALDLAAMEDSLVGESEARLRQAIAVIKAVGGGNAFVIATSNNSTIMRPELQRRFTAGWFFFDMMTKDERTAAWTYYMKKYGLAPQALPANEELWSAAEIRNCTRNAWNSNIPVAEAGRFIVPVAQARADEFDAMRQYANGRYLDAQREGSYRYRSEPMEKPVRALRLDEAGLAVAAIAATQGKRGN